MRRLRAFATVAALALALAGCGGNSAAAAADSAVSTPTAAPTATPALQAPGQAAAPSPAADDAAAIPDETGSGGLAPLDLATMSATMVYAQVSDLVMNPEAHEGQQITMQGQFTVYEGNPNNVGGSAYYFTVTIADATACCQQGVEFVLPDESAVYPDDYPEENSTITVTGRWQPYTESEYTYYHIVAESVA